MDRNYFLSYSQIVFLLLLSAVGKLNAKIISTTMSKSELVLHQDINATDLYLYLSDAFSKKSVNTVGCISHHHTIVNDDSHSAVFEHSLHKNFPVVSDQTFFLLSLQNLKSVAVWNKWRILSATGHIGVLSIFTQIKKFYINSIKLVDGFKFVIKIPDKCINISIK